MITSTVHAPVGQPAPGTTPAAGPAHPVDAFGAAFDRAIDASEPQTGRDDVTARTTPSIARSTATSSSKDMRPDAAADSASDTVADTASDTAAATGDEPGAGPSAGAALGLAAALLVVPRSTDDARGASGVATETDESVPITTAAVPSAAPDEVSTKLAAEHATAHAIGDTPPLEGPDATERPVPTPDRAATRPTTDTTAHLDPAGPDAAPPVALAASPSSPDTTGPVPEPTHQPAVQPALDGPHASSESSTEVDAAPSDVATSPGVDSGSATDGGSDGGSDDTVAEPETEARSEVRTPSELSSGTASSRIDGRGVDRSVPAPDLTSTTQLLDPRSLLARAELNRVAGRRLDVGIRTTGLGQVTVSAVDGADGVQLQLMSDRPDARARLADHLDELRTDLAEHDIELESLGVGSGAPGDGSGTTGHDRSPSDSPTASPIAPSNAAAEQRSRPDTTSGRPTWTSIHDGLDLQL